MSIYTRRGDHGETSLGNGARVSKDSLRVEAYGAIDEANSCIGLARTSVSDPALDTTLAFAQHRLLNCTAVLASPGATPPGRGATVASEDVAALEAAIERLEAVSGPYSGFVVEGGCETAARLQVARAVLRRAERRTVALAADEPVPDEVLAFLNRLSDTLFAAARYANTICGSSDELWDPSFAPQSLDA
ncbi:MAG: cob(I)yrinic acid a,c-diamide adenosyltransferase [Coriobacteriia bacterium]|nr:cob(I)yrinic acid a,c-diamide adenosyltransferase [Coriobacteriia bacterium]